MGTRWRPYPGNHRLSFALAFAVVIVACAGTLVACGGTSRRSSAVPADPIPSHSLERAPRASLVLRFDGTDLFDDQTATAPVTVAAVNGGTVELVRPGVDGTGGAVQFPPPCDGPMCPRAILLGTRDPGLDPGVATFAFGASVLVEPDDLTLEHGSNVVQKGLATTAQWKLQIDGAGEGLPSCVVRTTRGEDRIIVTSAVGVADGRWHRVICRRTAIALEIAVDGGVTGSVPIPADYSIVPAGQGWTVGGNSASRHNDQFHGVLDEVFFERDD